MQLNHDEMAVLLNLAKPIEATRQAEFLSEVAQELEAHRQAGEIGVGAVHRVARTIQRNISTRRSPARANQRGGPEPGFPR
jgi:hypothetical protein